MMDWKGIPSAVLTDYEVARIGYNNTVMGVAPSAEEVHNMACALQSSNTLIEEQAARIAEMELAQSEYEKVLNSYADENQRLSDAATASQARLSEAVKVLEALIERYEEIVTHDDVGRSLKDHDLSQAKAFLATLGEEND